MIDVQAHLPVLIVTVPLIGGVLTIVTGRGWKPWAWATFLTGTVFYLALRLIAQVLASPTGVVSYELGNWPRQWGIEYRVDALNSFILCIVAGVGFLTTIYAKESVAKEIPAGEKTKAVAAKPAAPAQSIKVAKSGNGRRG